MILQKYEIVKEFFSNQKTVIYIMGGTFCPIIPLSQIYSLFLFNACSPYLNLHNLIFCHHFLHLVPSPYYG